LLELACSELPFICTVLTVYAKRQAVPSFCAPLKQEGGSITLSLTLNAERLYLSIRQQCRAHDGSDYSARKNPILSSHGARAG